MGHLSAILAGAVLAGTAIIVYDAPADICSPGYARSHRMDAGHYYPVAKQVFAEHGIPWSARHAYELDHRVPLCLGGSNDPANLWPQPLDEAKTKDRLEWHACREVCAGHVSLSEARGWFADWKDAYRQVFGEQP